MVDSDTGFPVPTWLYRPAYLPDGLAIEIAAGTPLQEPGIFLLPFVRTGEGTGRPFEHAISFGEITHVRMGTPVGGLVSPAARWAESVGLLSVEPSDAYVLRLTFDRAANQRTADLRPALPPVFQW